MATSSLPVQTITTMTSTHTESLDALRREYEGKIEALRSAQKKLVAASTAEFEDRIRSLEKTLKSSADEQMLARLAAQQRDLELWAKETQAAALQAQSQTHAQEQAGWEEQIKSLKETVRSREKTIAEGESLLQGERVNLEALRKKYADKHDEWLKVPIPIPISIPNVCVCMYV